MQKIGIVTFVQIQRDHMKIHKDNVRFYRPAPLLKVEKLALDKQGIIGIDTDGNEILDVHNTEHPNSRYRGDNKISFGFLQHYHRMRERFGDHLKDGYAAENIIVDAKIDITKLDYTQEFFFKQGDDNVELADVIPAPPCREFSVFCLEVAQCTEDIKAALQFLSNGTRGYYADLASMNTPYYIQAGDELWVR